MSTRSCTNIPRRNVLLHGLWPVETAAKVDQAARVAMALNGQNTLTANQFSTLNPRDVLEQKARTVPQADMETRDKQDPMVAEVTMADQIRRGTMEETELTVLMAWFTSDTSRQSIRWK